MSHQEHYHTEEEEQKAEEMMTLTQARSSEAARKEGRPDWRAEDARQKCEAMKKELGVSGDVFFNDSIEIQGTLNDHTIRLNENGIGTIDGILISEKETDFGDGTVIHAPDPDGQALVRGLYKKYKTLALLRGDAKILAEQDKEIVTKAVFEAAADAVEFQRTAAAKNAARELLGD